MRWFPNNRAARNVIYCFAGVIILFFTTSLISLSGFNRVSVLFLSMYTDRLVPSMDLSHVIELQYKNRFLLEDAVSGLSGTEPQRLTAQISRNNQVIDSILNRYMVGHHFEPKEKQDLQDYNRNVQVYRKTESQIISLLNNRQRDWAQAAFREDSYRTFDRAMIPLSRLEDDQVLYGHRQYEEINSLSGRIQIVLLLFMGVAVIVAITLGIIISYEYVNYR